MFQLSGRRIEIYLAEPGSYLLKRHSLTLVKTKILWQENSILPAREKFSNSGRKIQFLVGKFQLSAQRTEIYLADCASFVLERLDSLLVETIISRGEY